MTSPGVENTSADQPGHHRTESNDSQATLTNHVAHTTAHDDRRSRKRAASADDDDDDGAHEAKRFRVTADTPAGPTAGATTAANTGSPTAAAPKNESMFTTAAPAVVDHHHDVDNEPDEVTFDGDALDAAAQVEGGGCGTDDFSSSDDELDDVEPSPPRCEWNVVGPARLGYDQFADWIDEFGMAWRLDVIPAPRPDAAVQRYLGFPSWEWTNLGPIAFGLRADTNFVDQFGHAWHLTLFRPARPDGGRAPPFTAPARGDAGPSNEADMPSDEVPSDFDSTCCCCRSCCCDLEDTDNEAPDGAPCAEPYRYRIIMVGQADRGFDRYAHYVDRYGVAWRREPVPPRWPDIDEASSSSDGDVPEDERLDDKLADAVVEDSIDDAVIGDAGAIEDADAEDDGCDAAVEYEDEDELEYAD